MEANLWRAPLARKVSSENRLFMCKNRTHVRYCEVMGGRMGSRAVAICSSIRVNRQWRLCFQWNGEEAVEVEFVDYHG
ncbi:hypothetical protein B5F89_00270 [Collinsella sp. An307]|nr:hypothetical protein B5F89_00270 [Collinsella sp. An307]